MRHVMIKQNIICNNVEAYAIFLSGYIVYLIVNYKRSNMSVGVVCCRLVLPSIVLMPKYRFDRDVENGGVV